MELRDFTGTLQNATVIQNNKNKLQTLPEKGEAIILGDIHGDLKTLELILSKEDVKTWLGDNHYIVFLGDYVDRGPFSLQVLQVVASLLIEHPENVLLLKGNHEGPGEVYVNPQSYFYEFSDEINPRDLMKIVQNFMDSLHTVAIIPDYAFLVHGHIPASTTSLERIAEAHLNHPNDPTLIEMLWSDPFPLTINSTNPRGQGYRIGTDTVNKFLDENKLKWVIRGHESYPLGYSVSDKTLTIHSLKLPVYGNPRPVYLKLPLDANREPATYLKHV